MSEEVIATTATEISAVSSVEGYINTYDLSTTSGKMKTINAYTNAVSLNDHVGEVLNICDVVTMPGERASRQQGVPPTPCQNTYIIDTDGTAYFSQSDGVKRSINVIAAMFPDFGKSTDAGCVQMVCKATKLKNGNTLKSLVLVS